MALKTVFVAFMILLAIYSQTTFGKFIQIALYIKVIHIQARYSSIIKHFELTS